MKQPKKPNPIAKELSSPKYRQRVVPSKKTEKVLKEILKERDETLRRLADR